LLKDITTPANRTQAYSIFTPSFTVGTMLGSILGGYAAQPSKESIIGQVAIFQQHPFLLPPVIYTVM
jgi:predicted MFS family arabinose efflux permease